jgi:hypothetical protein
MPSNKKLDVCCGYCFKQAIKRKSNFMPVCEVHENVRDFVIDYHGQVLKLVPSYPFSFPNNCPVIEKTGDGTPVGRCWFHMPNGVCPRHGEIEKIKREVFR